MSGTAGNTVPSIHTRKIQITQNLGRTMKDTRQRVDRLEREAKPKIIAIESALALLSSSRGESSSVSNFNKPPLFTEKQNIDSRITHVRNFLEGTSNEKALRIVLSYTGGAAHQWYLAQRKNGTDFITIEELFDSLETRFRILSKEKLAGDILTDGSLSAVQ